MAGISPKLPLSRNEFDGFALNKTILEAIRQNVRMLILTAPGERVMDPDFGVGIRRYLFEQAGPNVRGDIEARIQSQMGQYLPFVNIEDIDFEDDRVNNPSSGVTMIVTLRYTVSSLADINILAISVTETT